MRCTQCTLCTLCTQVPIAQHSDDDVMPVREQHGGDVDELARRALDRESAAVHRRAHLIDDNSSADRRLSTVDCRLLTVDC